MQNVTVEEKAQCYTMDDPGDVISSGSLINALPVPLHGSATAVSSTRRQQLAATAATTPRTGSKGLCTGKKLHQTQLTTG